MNLLERPKHLLRMRGMFVVCLGLICGEDRSTSYSGIFSFPHLLTWRHDASRGLQKREHSTGIDTGCCRGGCLTACILPGHRLVSVPARRVNKIRIATNTTGILKESEAEEKRQEEKHEGQKEKR